MIHTAEFDLVNKPGFVNFFNIQMLVKLKILWDMKQAETSNTEEEACQLL